MDFCETFKGGYCPVVKKHVPRSWCIARCNAAKKFPGFAEMAKGFAGSMVEYVKKGRPKRPEAEVERILTICRVCDEFDRQRGRCYLCGCKMKVKITWATTKCPLKKWEKYDGDIRPVHEEAKKDDASVHGRPVAVGDNNGEAAAEQVRV